MVSSSRSHEDPWEWHRSRDRWMWLTTQRLKKWTFLRGGRRIQTWTQKSVSVQWRWFLQASLRVELPSDSGFQNVNSGYCYIHYTLCWSYMKQCRVHTVLFTYEAVYSLHCPSPASEAVHSNFRMVYYGVPNLLKCCTFVLLDWNVFLGTLHFVTCSLYFSAAKLDDNIVLAPVTV